MEIKFPPQCSLQTTFLLKSCLFVLKELGLSHTVSLVVFDDAPWMQLIDCPLAVVAQPIEELAETAANLIIHRIQKPDRSAVQSIVLEPRLITRGTAQTLI